MMGLGMLIALPAMLVVVLVVLAMPMLAVFCVVRSSGIFVSRQAGPDTAVSVVCANCHRGIQADWLSCPYCGQKQA